MKRIIFVDDEENVLQGLRLMLRRMHKEWEMYFACSGSEALEIMEREAPFDVVVSDMRMPGMDGFEFLSKVMERHPQALRFALSGQSDSETFLKATNITHQFVNKPCDPDVLLNLIRRAFALRDRLSDNRLRQRLNELGTLPSLPRVYQETMAELQSPEPSVGKIGQIIEKDLGLSVKVLRIINSAMIGMKQHVSSPTQAASLLGLENLKSMVLMAGVFSQEGHQTMSQGLALDALWHHSLAVGQFSKKIAQNETKEKKVIDDSFTAGLLHDVGQVVLAAKMPTEFREAKRQARKEKVPLNVAETRLLGTSHAEVGGYMLELWGLLDPIVEAVVFHHRPSGCPVESFIPLTAVHAADHFSSQTEGKGEHKNLDSPLDVPYFEKLGLADHVQRWGELCRAPADG